jgi:hypothetical protein
MVLHHFLEASLPGAPPRSAGLESTERNGRFKFSHTKSTGKIIADFSKNAPPPQMVQEARKVVNVSASD